MIRTRVIPLKDRYSFIEISPRLALMYRALARPGKKGRMHKIQCAYFGFGDELSAKNFAAWLNAKYGARAIARESDRLDTAWEVKAWEFFDLLHVVHQCAEKEKAAA